MKECTKCKLSKPLSEYPKDKSKPDGHRARCKECAREAGRAAQRRYRARLGDDLKTRRRAYAESNRDKLNAQARAWYEENRERQLARSRAYRAEHPEKVTAGNLRRNYGITIEQYVSLLAHQEGVCAGCGVEQCPTGNAFAVDHDHAHCPDRKGCPDCVRGLLCLPCNMSDALAGKPAVDWGVITDAHHAASV